MSDVQNVQVVVTPEDLNRLILAHVKKKLVSQGIDLQRAKPVSLNWLTFHTYEIAGTGQTFRQYGHLLLHQGDQMGVQVDVPIEQPKQEEPYR